MVCATVPGQARNTFNKFPSAIHGCPTTIPLDVHQSVDVCALLCDDVCMATNIQIDNALVDKAMKLGGSRTKREAVNKALAEFVQRREQLRILGLFGTVDFDPGYNYKDQRAKK